MFVKYISPDQVKTQALEPGWLEPGWLHVPPPSLTRSLGKPPQFSQHPHVSNGDNRGTYLVGICKN